MGFGFQQCLENIALYNMQVKIVGFMSMIAGLFNISYSTLQEIDK